jgi:hypothetical protein
MAVITALRDALSLLRKHPVLFVPMAVFALLQIPQLFLNTLGPFVSIIVSLVSTAVFAFVTPVVYAGTIGMTNDAASGEPVSLGQFWTHVKEHYVSVLGAYLVIFGVSLGFWFLFSFLGIFALAGLGSAGLGLGVTVAVGVVAALVMVLYLAGLFAVHFYAHAIVIEDQSVTGGLTRSAEVVRNNIVSVLGYGVLSAVVGGVIGAVYAGLVTLAFPMPQAPGAAVPTPDLVPAILGSVGVFVGTTVFTAFFLAFSVTFYRTLIDTDENTSETGPTGTSVDTRRGDDAEFAG